MRIKILIIFLFLIFQVSAQNEKQKWTAGVSLALVKYVKAFQASVLGGGFVYQTPRFNISR